MKKYLIILLALLCLLFVSCGKGSTGTTPADTTAAPGDGTTPATPGDGTTAAGGETVRLTADYMILQGNGATNVPSGGGYDIRSAVQNRTGLTLSLGTDRSPASDYEILIGDTERSESQTAKSQIADTKTNDDTGVYLILCIGDKLVVTGDSELSTGLAIDRLIAEYLTGSGDAVFPANLRILETYSISAYEAELKRQKEEAAAAALAKKLKDVKDSIAALPTSGYGSLTTLSSTTYPTPTVFPTADQHPRVMINDGMLGTLRKNLAEEENVNAYTAYLQKAEQSVTGILPDVTESSSKFYNYDATVLSVIEAKAYRYALTGEELYGYEAVLAIQNYLTTLEIWTADTRYTTGYMTDIYRPFGYTMYITAEVYDWCYDLMTTADRTRIVTLVETNVAPRMEVGFPPTGQGAVTGHGSESQILRDWFAFAIATYDEFPDIYNFVMGRIESVYVPMRNYYYTSEMQSQGNSYGTYRFNFDLTAAYLYRTMTGGNELFTADLGAVARSFIFNLRPDNTLLRVGDDTGQRSAVYSMNSYGYCLFYAAAICDDGVAKTEAKRLLKSFTVFSYTDQSLSCVQFLILNNPELACEAVDTLPLAVYNGSPVGQIIARSSWTDEDAVLLYMKIGEYFAANHEHKDCGSFQIYYRGILASDSGFYDTYGSTVDNSYSKSTLAHNSLLIYNPDENTGSQLNVGGQKSGASESSTLDNWLAKEYTHRADVIGEEIGFGTDGEVLCSYIAGDLTNAYDAAKADEVLRYMYGAFTGDETTPLVFFVFDKITSDNPSFRKTFLLHCEEEPTVDGDLTVIRHDGGVLVNRTLLPGADRLNIEVIEGSYVIDGVSYEINRLDDTVASCERGWGRIEISPDTGNATDYLLNVMYVTGEENTAAYETAVLYENDLVAGASVLGYAAFFSRTAERLDGRFTVSGTGEGQMSYSVAGVKAGEWDVYTGSGTRVASATATEDGGLLRFTADAGTYIILPAGEDIADIPGDGSFPDPYPAP